MNIHLIEHRFLAGYDTLKPWIPIAPTTEAQEPPCSTWCWWTPAIPSPWRIASCRAGPAVRWAAQAT